MNVYIKPLVLVSILVPCAIRCLDALDDDMYHRPIFETIRPLQADYRDRIAQQETLRENLHRNYIIEENKIRDRYPYITPEQAKDMVWGDIMRAKDRKANLEDDYQRDLNTAYKKLFGFGKIQRKFKGDPSAQDKARALEEEVRNLHSTWDDKVTELMHSHPKLTYNQANSILNAGYYQKKDDARYLRKINENYRENMSWRNRLKSKLGW